jgi:hypothetical protein
MKNDKSITIWILIINLLIIVVAGHGIACLGLIEIFWLPQFYGFSTNDFSLSLAISYDKSLGIAAMFSIFGQIMLILTLIIKRQSSVFLTQIVGLLLLWIGFFYLTHHLFSETGSQIGFVTGIPFLIASILLFYGIVKQKMKIAASL